MKKYFKWLAGASLLFFLTTVFAQQIKSLYRIEIPVASQQAAARAEGLRDALVRVLVKVSGNGEIADNPAIQEKLGSAEALVNEFGYVVPPANSDAPLRLWVSFDPEGVNKLLKNAGVPAWGGERPVILPWLVSTLDGQEAHVLTEEQDVALVQAFQDAAKRRGLPVIFPLMDLADVSKVGPADILANRYPVLLSAAKRYGSGAILVGEIVPVAEGYRLTASLRLSGDHWEWDVTGKDPVELFASLTDRMAGILSAHYATEADAEVESDIHLTIAGIRGAEDMTALTKYLQHFASVASVDVLQVLDDSVVLDLRLRGSMASFNREVSLGQRLVPVPEQSLAYQWKG